MRPGLRSAFIAGFALSLVPLVVVATLVAQHALAPGHAFAAAVTVLAGNVVLAGIWLPDLFRLAAAPGTVRFWPQTRIAAQLARAAQQRRIELAAAVSRADRAVVDLLPDPLLILAADRSLRRANQAARDMLGADIPAVLRHPTLRAALDRAGTPQHGVQAVELLIPVPVPRDLHVTIIDLAIAQDDSARTAVVFADRTRARAVERMRADFVANASHELRTPLASLVGFIDTLRGPAADDLPAQQRFLTIMAEQAARMNRLIDDLLSLSRIELNEHLAPSARVDLPALIRRTLSGFEPRRLQAGGKLATDIEVDLPVLLADADQLEQVLQNLLDNALKYSRPGSTIHLGLRPAAGGRWPARPGVVLSVRDEGQGIPREHLPRLTERFYRVDRGRSRAAGGTGLGLAIVKHIVNRHRGQMLVESEEGIGSTFSVWLPLAG